VANEPKELSALLELVVGAGVAAAAKLVVFVALELW